MFAKLERPQGIDGKPRFRRVECECGTRSTFSLILDDNGRWSVDCDNCGAAYHLNEIIGLMDDAKVEEV